MNIGLRTSGGAEPEQGRQPACEVGHSRPRL